MKITEIVSIVEGKVICGHELLQKEVQNAFSSDLLSDVLKFITEFVRSNVGVLHEKK